MTTVLTIRTAAPLKEALARRAKEQGKSTSELAREILAEALAERPLRDRIGSLRGRLEAATSRADGWHASLRAANWRR